jgi:hypothetical protein
VSKEESDVKMEDTEPMANGNDDKAEASMANGTSDKQKDLETEKDARENKLPEDNAAQEEPIVVVTSHQNPAMEIDGEDATNGLVTG